ncbi:alpha/beta hydrolase [Hufsiella ginkgonis]|uniref:Alpha/beta fold hydrolase n=1 Tax=Hufsiella ginkgonis TaxID=2695274 RepID=A0A7K1XY95_9SPHI|nr:alpha/beta hydrolase [Hufsiella ginkgonis]MXV15719.1 alpha/beta fold hydrolase [Hufsiella ginkgonis]
MLKRMVFLLLLTAASRLYGQRTDGLTGKRDTSYTTWSAFQSTVKKYPEIRIAAVGQAASVKEAPAMVYRSLNDRDLHLDAFYPAGKRRKLVPAILIIHGGGWRSGDRSQHIPLARKLAERGYACFTVEYRLSTEALYPAAIEDLQAALEWVRSNSTQFHADRNKVAVLGFSAGGELAAYLGTTQKVQAIVDIDGTLSFVHPESGEGDDSRSVSAATWWFGFAKKDNPALWAQASPLAHVGKNTPPTLFLNSAVDRMHAGRDDFRKVLDTFHTYSEVHTFEGAPHSFCLFEPWFTPTVAYTDQFLRKIFGGNRK